MSKDWTVHICKGTSDPFNIVNDHIDRKLFKELLYGPGFKSSSVHEMGTWILKSRSRRYKSNDGGTTRKHEKNMASQYI